MRRVLFITGTISVTKPIVCKEHWIIFFQSVLSYLTQLLRKLTKSSDENNEFSNTAEVPNCMTSVSRRSQPSSGIPPSSQHGSESMTYRLSENYAASKLLVAVFHFQDDVFQRVADTDSKEVVLLRTYFIIRCACEIWFFNKVDMTIPVVDFPSPDCYFEK